jgi:predicted ATPase
LLELAALEGNLPREAAEHSVREARAERQRELWLRLWQQLLAQGPALVAIEDLHWANESAFEYLAALLSLSHTSPLLLVVTSRPGMLPNSPYWLGTLKSAAVLSLDLGPLSAKEGRELARELAIDQRDHIEAAIERSGGHPLFLEQILRAKRPAHLTPSIHVVENVLSKGGSSCPTVFIFSRARP